MSNTEQVKLIEFIGKAEERFKNAPAWMRFDQEQSFAIQQLTANEFLEKTARANPVSLLSAMSNVASIGLSLNPAKKQAYLVPRKGVVCLDPSYMGLCDLATQSGSISFVQAKTVREKDTYVNNGIDEKPTHIYQAFGDRGGIVGVYCVAKTHDGNYLTSELEKPKIDAIMGRSEAAKKGGGPWITDYEEMAKKSVVRQAFKLWPKTETMERLALAVDLSNQNEDFEPLPTSPELTQFTTEEKKYFDSLITSNDSIRMFVFMTSLESGVQTSLFNSFEKGSIGKYKQVVRDLTEKGRNQMTDIIEAIKGAAETGDDLAAKELLSDLSSEAIEYIKGNVQPEIVKFINECMGN